MNGVKSYSHACIAYIVGRLIAGKSVTSIYDYSRAVEIRREDLPDQGCLKEFNYENWSFLSGSPGVCKYQYSCNAGHSIDIAIKGNTFIGYIRGSSSHFIGTVKGDSVYLYDQRNRPISTTGYPATRSATEKMSRRVSAAAERSRFRQGRVMNRKAELGKK